MCPNRSEVGLGPQRTQVRVMWLVDLDAEEGRDYSELEITAMWTLRGGMDELKAYRDMGVARLNVPLQALPDRNPLAGIAKLHDEVISKID